MIDARGRSCPEPVILCKQAMASKEAHYEILVDNRVSVENVTRFAQHSGYRVTAEKSDGEYKLSLDKN